VEEVVIFIIYLIIGLIVSSLTIPRAMTKYAAKEWPSLEWDGGDTAFCIFFTVYAAFLWPLIVVWAAFVLVSRAGIFQFIGGSVHRALVKEHRYQQLARKGRS
jgi:hypothetical protein